MSSLQDNIVRHIDSSIIDEFLSQVIDEYWKARNKFGPTASLHEALSVLIKEVKEVEKLIYINVRSRDDYVQRDNEIQVEAMQVAAMAMALALENRPDAIPWFWNDRSSDWNDRSSGREKAYELDDPFDDDDPFVIDTDN